jgi:hypothetical protein
MRRSYASSPKNLTEKETFATMQFNWENFENRDAKHHDEIYATLSTRGDIYLNSRAYKALGEPDSVMLMYDRQLNVVGIKAAISGHKRGFRLFSKNGGKCKGRGVYAAQFCRHFSIRPDRTCSFPSVKLTDDGVLVLDLNDARPVEQG